MDIGGAARLRETDELIINRKLNYAPTPRLIREMTLISICEQICQFFLGGGGGGGGGLLPGYTTDSHVAIALHDISGIAIFLALFFLTKLFRTLTFRGSCATNY